LPTGFWFDVPFFSDLQSRANNRDSYIAKLNGINGMYGFHWGYNNGIQKREEGDKPESYMEGPSNRTQTPTAYTLPTMPELTNKIVYGNASAIELCTIPGAFGPSYVSLTEMKFCNLTSLELSDITVPLPAGKVVRSDTPTIDFVLHHNTIENGRGANADADATVSTSQHKAVKLQLGFKGIMDLATI
jgi:hypothetical protein